jgi:uncharacterized membrane protein YphA (DoxX/SURF4 family)
MSVNLPSIQEKHGVLLLRIVMGFIFITHGAARIYYDSVAAFGEFLNSQGLLIGICLAWTIIIGEIISGALLALGFKVQYLVIFHFLIILGGIFLVHLKSRWFGDTVREGWSTVC